MGFDEFITIIKSVADEQGYMMSSGNRSFEVYLDKYNAVAFSVYANSSSGYIQVHQWEEGTDETEGRYGKGVYSIRSTSDVIHFCNILISSAQIRAKRRD